MLQAIIKSCVRAEATVGAALVVLLITGRTDSQAIALSLAVLGGAFLFSGLLVLMRRLPKEPQPMTKEERALKELEKDAGPVAKGRVHWVSARRRYMTSSISMCAVLLANAALIYWLSPVAV
jgi:hypothetical protein